METDPDYDETAALAVYQTVRGLSDFGESVETNFLIDTILDLMVQYIPNASDYVGAYQEAVITAWSYRGTVLEKFEAMQKVLERSDIDTTHLDQVMSQLMELVSVGVTDTMNMALGMGGSDKWVVLLSSAMHLAREHFPEGYIAWLYSTDDTESLYSQGNLYRMLAWTGSMDAVITTTDPASGENTVVFDTKAGINTLAAANLQSRICVALPAVRDYQVTLTSADKTVTQIGYGMNSTVDAALQMQSTNPVTIYAGETIRISLPATQDPEALA